MYVRRKKFIIASILLAFLALVITATGMFFIIQALLGGDTEPEICIKSMCMPPGLFRRSASNYACSPLRCVLTSLNNTEESSKTCVRKECITRDFLDYDFDNDTVCIDTVCLRESAVLHLESGGICHSEDCIRAAARILKWMGQTIDPCDNFYNFSCRGFFTNETIPSGQETYGVTDIELDKASLAIRKILEFPILPNNDSDALQKVKTVYQSCIDEGALEEVSASFVSDVLEMSKLGEWPMVETKDGDCKIDIEWKTAMLHVYGVEALFRLEVQYSDEDSSAFIKMSVAPPLVEGVCSQDNPNRERDRSEFRDMLHEIQGFFIKHLHPSVKRESKRFVDEIIDLDIKFCQATEQSSIEETSPHIFNNTLEELAAMTRKFNFRRWHNILSSEMDIDSRMKNAPFYVHDVHLYINNITDLLSGTHERIISNYLSIKFLLTYMGSLGPDFLSIAEQHASFLKRHTTYTLQPLRYIRRKQLCQEYLEKVMGIALIPSFISKMIPETVESEMKYLAELVKIAFYLPFKNSYLLNAHDKKEIMNKIEHFDTVLLYPQENETFYDDYYSDLEDLGSSFFENGLKIGFHHQKKIFEAVYRGANASDVELLVLLENPFKSRVISAIMENKTFVFLGSPHVTGINPNVPRYMNLATLGTTIAHEYVVSSYLLSDSSVNHIYDHESKTWLPWSEDIRNYVAEEKQCYRYKYSTENQDTMRFSVDQIIADVQALKDSLEAYRVYVEKYGHVPVLQGFKTDYDDEQLFFLLYAQSMCSMRTSYINGKTLIAPYMDHVNEVLRNLGEFSDAFQCPKESHMNPYVQCGPIW